MVTESQVRELGQQIYDERARLAAEPEVAAAGEKSEKQRRIEELDLAARWNAIALRGFSRSDA